MTAPSLGWRPLPECSECGRPTRRSTWTRLGGRCSACGVGRPILGEERLELHEWQQTAARRGQGERQAAAERRARRYQR